jgi:hypothetical protein
MSHTARQGDGQISRLHTLSLSKEKLVNGFALIWIRIAPSHHSIC